MRDTVSRNVLTDASSFSVQPVSIVSPPSVSTRRLNSRRDGISSSRRTSSSSDFRSSVQREPSRLVSDSDMMISFIRG